MRETLFNWLAPVIEGAACLDLYAGSGALGLEALSRGAGRCVFVDRQAAAVDRIKEHLAMLECDDGSTQWSDAARYVERGGGPFDVVFLDPPFGEVDPGVVCGALERGGLVADGGRVYVECPASSGVPELPAGWELARSRRAGRVGYHLVIRHAGPVEEP